MKKNISPLHKIKKAVMIGTDYDFCFNTQLRQTIMETCIDSDLRMLEFNDYIRLDPTVETLLNQSYDSFQDRRNNISEGNIME